MKIAVVGAGIFGTTVAIALAKEGFTVDLIEKEPDILCAASGINQFRLHKGYHYPRSLKTAISSKNAEASFRREYRKAVLDDNNHYYCIATEDSKLSGKEFIKFCNDCRLDFSVTEIPHVLKHKHDIAICVKEAIIDHTTLKSIILKRLKKYSVNVILNTKFSISESKYDLIVNCTYANMNSIHNDASKTGKIYQFEVCEKPVIRLPKNFSKMSIVILDGPFFCIDPYGRTDLHLMGHVVHAIHASNTGFLPKIPKKLLPFLNKGIIYNPPITNIKKFLKSASQIIPDIAKAEHIGSMYTVRTVLPNTDKTDERPTIVSKINDRLIQVFSGKIGNCVQAAEEVVKFTKEIKNQ